LTSGLGPGDVFPQLESYIADGSLPGGTRADALAQSRISHETEALPGILPHVGLAGHRHQPRPGHTQTTGQVEATVTFGSAAVLLLIGLGVFVVVRRGLRPIEAMASHADRITGGDLTGRVATHDNTRSEVGRQSAARGTLGVQGATGHWAFRVLRAVLR
jgi:HAMP domain-containing protein